MQDFTLIPYKFSKESKPIRYFYAKPHNVRGVDLTKPEGRTLLVCNVPSYCDEDSISRLFEVCGRVKNVEFQKKPTTAKLEKNTSTFFPDVDSVKGYKVAYIVFKNEKSLSKVKDMSTAKNLYLSTNENPIITGVEKWCQDYASNVHIDVDELQKEVDTYMEKYDRRVEEEKQRQLEADGQPDEDGWITVGKYGKNKGAPRTEIHSRKMKEKLKKSQKEKELLDFYAFQMKDSKKAKIAELRQKFEEDKQKIELMKAQRKFRPY